MATFLIKTEPDCYNIEQMKHDKRTHWDGVHNAAAQKHLRSMKVGDEAYFYHTGDEKAIVGLVKVVRGPYPDPDQPGTTANGDPKGVLVDFAFAKNAKKPVTLGDIKEDPRFAEFELVRISRLGVMPVPPALDKIIRSWAGL